MRPEPKLTLGARADLREAAIRYGTIDPSLGYAFLDEFERVTSLIQESPLLFTLVDPPVRRALFKRFPYVAIVDLRQEPAKIRRAYER